MYQNLSTLLILTKDIFLAAVGLWRDVSDKFVYYQLPGWLTEVGEKDSYSLNILEKT